MATPRDRRGTLAAQSALNGIDFVEVVAGSRQTRLRIHFINPSPDATALRAAVTGASVTGGETIPTVPATLVDWGSTGGRPWLELAVPSPGDFSTYTLRLLPDTQIIDPFFAQVTFSFKADCPSDLDREQLEAQCVPQPDH